jgi:hypothetical protein
MNHEIETKGSQRICRGEPQFARHARQIKHINPRNSVSRHRCAVPVSPLSGAPRHLLAHKTAPHGLFVSRTQGEEKSRGSFMAQSSWLTTSAL